MKLPSSMSELSKLVQETGDLPKLISNDNDNLTPSGHHILQYIALPLTNGRPLGKVLIMMAGETGSGKSATINRLFEDPNLCPTSATQSMTSNIIEYSKSLQVTKVSPDILADLVFVDVPGALDTDSSQESANFLKVKNYRLNSVSLQNRDTPLPLKALGIKFRANVFPNLVLFVFNCGAHERTEGQDSSLNKSLKILKEFELVDNNLIIVCTHALALASSPKKFKEKVDSITARLQKAAHRILGVNNASVIFVENEPENYELPQISGFFKLPDDQLSHYNLIEAIQANFNQTQDKLGLLLTSWYFRSDCPDKLIKTNVQEAPDPEPQHQLMTLKNLSINCSSAEAEFPEFQVPIFQFHSLGYSYCPVTENLKSHYVFREDDKQTLRVGNSKFQIPSFVKSCVDKSTHFQRLCYENKEDYESHKKTQYGMEADLKIVVGVTSQGKWVKSKSSAKDETIVSMVHEYRLASLQIDSPERFISPELETALRGLTPGTYESDPDKFTNFFSKWGTHFAWKQFVGGSIKLDCIVQTAAYNQKLESALEVKAGFIFNALFGGANFNYESEFGELKSIGISDERITISGGEPPMIASMKQISPELIQEWKKSVENDPKELEHSFMLYPYYNLSQCPNPGELREATKDYLRQQLKPTDGRMTRDEIAEKGHADAVASSATNGGAGCFPGTTKVRTTSGPVQISKLTNKHSLTTIELSSTSDTDTENFAHKLTQFCTFLHSDTTATSKFLVFSFSNGATLAVTPEHLLLAFAFERRNFEPKQAKNFKVGDSMVYVDEMNSNSVSIPTIIQICSECRDGGLFCPLTTTGTFLANGILVTCYADVKESFKIAHLAMAPLRTWCALKAKIYGVNNAKHDRNSQAVGIHNYAKILMSLRKFIAACSFDTTK